MTELGIERLVRTEEVHDDHDASLPDVPISPNHKKRSRARRPVIAAAAVVVAVSVGTAGIAFDKVYEKLKGDPIAKTEGRIAGELGRGDGWTNFKVSHEDGEYVVTPDNRFMSGCVTLVVHNPNSIAAQGTPGAMVATVPGFETTEINPLTGATEASFQGNDLRTGQINTAEQWADVQRDILREPGNSCAAALKQANSHAKTTTPSTS